VYRAKPVTQPWNGPATIAGNGSTFDYETPTSNTGISVLVCEDQPA
jgi:hypothetical protein